MANSERVLVADDDEDDLKFFSDLLRQDGFQVETAPNGGKAISLLEESRFDLVVTDLVMPKASGFEVLQTALKTNPEVIAIALTSHGSLDSAIDALGFGAYSYLLKPCDAQNFRHCLQRGLEKQRLTKELRLRNQELETLNRELDSRVQQATADLRLLNVQMLTEMASLKEVDELKTSFINTVSHDLRSPVTTIMGYISHLLGEGQTLTAEQRSCLQKAQRATFHIEYLITQILDAARLNSGTVRANCRDFPVAEIVDECLSLIAPQAEAAGLKLESDVSSLPPALTLRADRGQLTQVLSNLLANANKFTPKGGRVTLKAESNVGTVRFCVEDTGPGIAAEHLPRIFDKFYQVDRSPSKPHKGLGLGLRIAKDLVGLHQGKIWVESELGKGSRFFVELPLQGPSLGKA